MRVEEFDRRTRTYRRQGLRKLAATLGITVLYTVGLVGLPQAALGMALSDDVFLALYGAGALGIVGWVLAGSRAWNERYNLRCPGCRRWLVQRRAFLMETGHCPYCWFLIIEDAPLADRVAEGLRVRAMRGESSRTR